MKSSWKSLLGLANRAGKCVSGEELVVKEIRQQRAKMILLAEDASANTRKKLIDKCTYYQVPYYIVPDRIELGNAIGKEQRVTVAVIDNGFAKKLKKLIDQ
ncbi:YlxQ family RNA-binding protein [Pseudalkalibacillus salsuginis]|uniref:YlxQ family RNA-binding protein n=1 Tax=Pseudalkalibacillus salsuginis TaxID=2910972 RepID=UPI001CD3B99E|nr:YlxQ family RNA-binding protein [Pseudalkalibacillus salsuginis]MCF6410609.1 YlxQ family RNA-binding protein [Pseudalkalibacillus salsuginis]